jgi:O-antigen/teichoic acid export membrane protein
MTQTTSTQDSVHKAAGLMLMTRLGVKFLGIISSLTLVRLLSPEDFGLVAIAMSVYSLVEVFGLFGFNNALIQKDDVDNSDYNTVFTANFLFGLSACTLLFLSSPFIAYYYSEPALQGVLQSISLMFIIKGAINVRTVDFQKHMNFKNELIFQLVPKALSVVITLTAAFIMKSYIALIIGMLFNNLSMLILGYIMKPYRPSFSLKGIGNLFGYSKWLMLNSLLFYINNNSLNMIVGKFISTKAAGLYSISNEIASLPLHEIAAPINKASFPAYSKAKNDNSRLNNLFTETTMMIVLLALPASAGLIVVAEDFTNVVLGEKWAEATDLIKYIALSSFVASLGTNIGYIYMAIGKPKFTFLISLFRTVMFILFLILLLNFDDISSAAKAMFAATLLTTTLSFIIVHKIAKIDILTTLYAMKNPFASSLLMAGCVHLFYVTYGSFFDIDGLRLICAVSIGGISYCLFIILFWRLSGAKDGVEKKILNRVGLFR